MNRDGFELWPLRSTAQMPVPYLALGGEKWQVNTWLRPLCLYRPVPLPGSLVVKNGSYIYLIDNQRNGPAAVSATLNPAELNAGLGSIENSLWWKKWLIYLIEAIQAECRCRYPPRSTRQCFPEMGSANVASCLFSKDDVSCLDEERPPFACIRAAFDARFNNNLISRVSVAVIG